MKTFKVGEEVWYKSTYSDVNTGIVLKTPDDGKYLKVKGCRDCHGTHWTESKGCYHTKQELLANLKLKHSSRQKEFRNSIKTVEDLVRFMYTHTVSSAEEYTDWDAREVVKQSAK